LPGDKSISHRALLLNALAEGSAVVRGVNPGADVLRTAAVLRALGVRMRREDSTTWALHGRAARLRPPSGVLDCGNSGTTLRLLAGILAAQPFTSTLDGDESLRRRPMERVAVPLRRMGARVEGPSNGSYPPLVVTGGALESGHHTLAMASAQVKGCLLLAALTAGVALRVEEPFPSRDHTERWLRAMGAPLRWGEGWAELACREQPLRSVDFEVPGDPSAAALVAACALVVPGSDVSFPGLAASRGRLGFLNVLDRMGVPVERRALRAPIEDVITLRLRSPRSLRATRVETSESPTLIDEIPALAALAANARGRTVFRGIAELRVKESDRVQSIEGLLRSFGIRCGSEADVLWIEGGRPRSPGRLQPSADHRIAMASVALARSALVHGPDGAACEIDIGSAEVSFPGFRSLIEELELGIGA
jgi:3-phosphoshikimate 1-carboxyvinyltransferase